MSNRWKQVAKTWERPGAPVARTPKQAKKQQDLRGKVDARRNAKKR